MVHLLALTGALLSAQPSAVDFADSLMIEGDYYRAIGEYKRFLFEHPDDPGADQARLAIGTAYVRGGQASAAAEYFTHLAETQPQLRERSRLGAGYARYVAGDYAQARLELSRWLSSGIPHDPAWTSRAQYLLGWTDLSLGHPDSAADEIQALPEFSGKPRLVEQIRAFDDLPHRSPLVAGLLAIVPGAGHLYIGQPLTALAALIWNALFTVGSVQSFRSGNWGAGMVLAVFEVLWYSGNIFGAVSGAYKFNRDAEQNAMDALRASFDDRPEAWPPNPR